MKISAALTAAIDADDLADIRSNLPRDTASQDELNECLILAMPESSLDTIGLLLQRGAKLKSGSFFDMIARGDTAVFQLLIDSGWDIDSTDFEVSSVHCALRDETLLRWLLENGADPDTMSQRRFSGSCLQCTTPLADAANHSDSTALQLLLKHGAKIDPEAIFHSIGIPRSRPAGTATMQILIDQGADVNHFSKRWCTPLYHAVHMNQEDHVRLLLDHGAKPSVESIIGKVSALDHAKEKGRMNLYEMIEASGSHGSPCVAVWKMQ